jgi:hypothetical protein
MKTRYIEIGISLFLLVLFNFGNNATITKVSGSEPQPTITQVFAEQIEVFYPDIICFTVYVTADGNPVSGGQVTVYEETDPFITETDEISDGIAFFIWRTESDDYGNPSTFIANYEGTSSYDPSSDSTEVYVNYPIEAGSQTTETTVLSNTTIAYTNDTIEFDITMQMIDGIWECFDGGYVALVDLTENLVLQYHEITYNEVEIYTLTFTQTIPFLFMNGTHTFEIRYSGSKFVDHAPSSASVDIQIINDYVEPPPENYSISMTGDMTSINRGLDTLLINATLEGDDPTDKILQLYSYQDNGAISDLVEEVTVTSREYTYSYTADETALEGPIIFELSLLDEGTYETKATVSISATIIDPIIVYETTISLDQDIYEITMGNGLIIPVYITSSSGKPMTEGQIHCEIAQNEIILQELVGDITNGYTEFTIPTETFSEGIFDLHFSYPGNATQNVTTHNAEIQILKITATFESAITTANMEYGTSTSWSARVTNDMGVGIPNVPIKFETKLIGFYWDDWGTIMTNGTGYATIDITWLDETQENYGRPGDYSVRISIVENDKVYTDEELHSLSVTKNSVIFTLEDAIIAHLGTGILQGTLTTSTGDPLVNTEIDLYWNCTTHGWYQKINTVITDEFGNYYQEVTVNEEPGFFILEAYYDGNYYYTADTKEAILEVIDNPSEVKKIEITPAILDLGDTTQINVTAADIDSISSVTAFIYYNAINFTMPLEFIDNSYQTTIWCGTDYDIGTWTINLIVIDNLGIETVFANAGQFVIAANPAPTVNYTVTPETIPDGGSVNFEISASDTLGIQSVQIEIGSTIYDITDNITIIEESTEDTIDSDNLREGRRIYYTAARARGPNVFYFTYTPSTAGIIPYTIYVTDNAGQMSEIDGSIMVEAIAPELSVLSLSTLNGTAPFSFALNLKVTDGSGINYIQLYINEEEFDLDYDDFDNSYSYSTLFPAGSYIITVIAEDNVGTQATLDLGTLNVEPADYSVLYASEVLFDGESTEFTIQASNTLAFTNVTITLNENEERIETLDGTGALTGEIQFDQPGIYTVTFSITDSLGTQIIHEYNFNITAKAPVIESIYPNAETLATMYTPLDLNFETIVSDASGVASVILYVNDTEYLLSNNFDLWYTTISLEKGNYTLSLIATDIYGAETTYNLGEITAKEETTTTTNEPTKTPKESSDTTQTTTDLVTTVGMIGISLVTLTGTVLVKWKKRF